jgi:Uma2 family endonuclease
MSLQSWPDHLLTLQEWDDLPEDVSRQFELVDGVLQVSPRPTIDHQHIIGQFYAQTYATFSAEDLVVVLMIDVVLLGDPLPLVRAPDIAVITREFARTAPKRAADLILAIEIISPGSSRRDRIAKMIDYAEAGIENYWIIETDGIVTLDAYLLVAGAYELTGHFDGGAATLTRPTKLTVDLDALVIR